MRQTGSASRAFIIIPAMIAAFMAVLVKDGISAQQAKKKTPYEVTRAMDWKLTPERRAAIEAGIPETKGFIDGNEIVQEIREKNIRKKEDRVKLFMKKAKGKYILFAAQANPNPFNDNASLNLIFGEGGLMPDFMMVQLRSPKNFDRAKYIEKYGGTGYVTVFVGKLINAPDLTLEPVYDIYLPGYWK
ncbi:MAG: hypothetical protein KA369_03505 [Spirochaetes bacterium]|nr:hypothetical protein [Spirochaetota bacterium]